MGSEVHNKVRVTIGGSTYTVRGQVSESHLHAVGKMVDDLMQQVATANPSLDTKRVAVLAALNMADELQKLRVKYDELLALVEGSTQPASKP